MGDPLSKESLVKAVVAIAVSVAGVATTAIVKWQYDHNTTVRRNADADRAEFDRARSQLLQLNWTFADQVKWVKIFKETGKPPDPLETLWEE